MIRRPVIGQVEEHKDLLTPNQVAPDAGLASGAKIRLTAIIKRTSPRETPDILELDGHLARQPAEAVKVNLLRQVGPEVIHVHIDPIGGVRFLHLPRIQCLDRPAAHEHAGVRNDWPVGIEFPVGLAR